MDKWKANPNDSTSSLPQTCNTLHASFIPDQRSRHRVDGEEAKDPIAARKVQKADREKLRRDRLNDHFIDLGHTLDPDRPRNDKATILTDTIQVLKDLTAEVNRLKAEFAALSEESSELTQEKNELREEKASLKSDIESLNIQYQQRLRVMFPWTAVDPSVVMAPPYSYPVPVAIPSGPIPMHPSMQPYPFFGNQNPGAIPSPCSTFIPYPSPNPPNERPFSQHASTSHISCKHELKNRSTDHPKGRGLEKCDDSDDVATDLELKMPGSSAKEDVSNGQRKGKQSQKKSGSTSSQYSSSLGIQDSSSNSIGDVPRSNK